MRPPGSLTSKSHILLHRNEETIMGQLQDNGGSTQTPSPGVNLPSSWQFVSSHQLPASRPLLALSLDVPEPHAVSTERDKNLLKASWAAS